ncbi:MAG: hypothetical protein JWN70_5886 [Planctomycetaceae bacterium]|nr:hypothetical protein [Planctomycetaceae bacterium]
MSQTGFVLLEFMGGPFDGFKRTLSRSSLAELPNAIALPMNRRTRKVFSLGGEDSTVTAIYRLTSEYDCWQYRFCVVRSTGRLQARSSDAPKVNATQFGGSPYE